MSYCWQNYFRILIVDSVLNKDEKTKTYCVICSFDNMLVIAEKLWWTYVVITSRFLAIINEIYIIKSVCKFTKA